MLALIFVAQFCGNCSGNEREFHGSCYHQICSISTDYVSNYTGFPLDSIFPFHVYSSLLLRFVHSLKGIMTQDV